MIKFELLRERSIIDILDGDTDFGILPINGADSNIKVSMPYLSGYILCSISNKFGLNATYSWSGGALSRWVYLDNLIEHCIKSKQELDLLSFLFSKSQFMDKLKGNLPETIKYAHNEITKIIVKQINELISFDGDQLVYDGTIFKIQKKETNVVMTTPSIKKIDRFYIADICNRSMKDIEEKNYDSAITKSRTLLEEVFCYVIEKKDEKPSENGNIIKLYDQVKQLYSMHQNKDMDKRINGLLSGLEKILFAISDMRNKGSDSHGIGSKRIEIDQHHARLFVNSSVAMSEFILAVYENNKSTTINKIPF